MYAVLGVNARPSMSGLPTTNDVLLMCVLVVLGIFRMHATFNSVSSTPGTAIVSTMGMLEDLGLPSKDLEITEALNFIL